MQYFFSVKHSATPIFSIFIVPKSGRKEFFLLRYKIFQK